MELALVLVKKDAIQYVKEAAIRIVWEIVKILVNIQAVA